MSSSRLIQKLEMVLEGSPLVLSQGLDLQYLKMFLRSADLLRAQIELEGLEALVVQSRLIFWTSTAT